MQNHTLQFFILMFCVFLYSVVHRRCFSESFGFLVLVSRSLAFSVARVASGGSRHGARGAASGESALPWFDLWPV